jgi:hypothetical protein
MTDSAGLDMKVKATYSLIAILFCFPACSAHSPFIVTNTTQSSAISQNKYSAHNDRVFITVQSLPSSVEFDLISNIDVGRIWYGSSQNIYTSMADRARELGANAIIQAKTWHQPSGFSWAAPHGSGQAVRMSDLKAFEALGIKGSWH